MFSTQARRHDCIYRLVFKLVYIFYLSKQLFKKCKIVAELRIEVPNWLDIERLRVGLINLTLGTVCESLVNKQITILCFTPVLVIVEIIENRSVLYLRSVYSVIGAVLIKNNNVCFYKK